MSSYCPGEGVFGTALKFGAFAGKVAAHATAGGVMSVLNGGKFGHGFAAAGVTQAFSGAIDGIGAGEDFFSAGNRAIRVIAAATLGGTASKLSGGKFSNGAITGAFSRLFNDEVLEHQAEAAKQKDLLDRKIKAHLTTSIDVSLDANGKLEAALKLTRNIDLKYSSKTNSFSGTIGAGPGAIELSINAGSLESFSGSLSGASLKLSNFSGTTFKATLSIKPVKFGGFTLFHGEKISTNINYKFNGGMAREGLQTVRKYNQRINDGYGI